MRLQVLSETHPELNNAVIAALKDSSWTPARVRGVAVEGPITVQIDFVLRVQPPAKRIEPPQPTVAGDRHHAALTQMHDELLQVGSCGPMDGHGRNACVSVEVNDADAYYREWSAKVAVLRPPRDEEWDARTFDLIDPFGNTLFVMGPVSKTTHRE